MKPKFVIIATLLTVTSVVIYTIIPVSGEYTVDDVKIISNKTSFNSFIKDNFVEEVTDNINNSTPNSSSGMSKETQDIIAMDDVTFWNTISNNRFSSYQEASAAWRSNPSSEKAFWTSMVVDIEVPIWSWADKSYSSKISTTTKIKVNKTVSQLFVDFMTDLYNLPEKYVIVSVGGFAPRLKNNGSSNPGLSAHTFGTTLDINAFEDGMGSVPAGGAATGVPYASSKNLPEPQKSQCCTLDNSWLELAKKYQFNWGGLWSYSSQDPMHFSIVGDGAKKGEVNYTPRGSYK